jgi:hypothetical protein
MSRAFLLAAKHVRRSLGVVLRHACDGCKSGRGTVVARIPDFDFGGIEGRRGDKEA